MKLVLRILFNIAVIVAIYFWLRTCPTTARIVWRGYEINTSAEAIAVSALLLSYIFYVLFRMWHFVRHGPERWRLRRKLKKIQQGHDYLTNGLVAIAGGDAAEAGSLAVRARKILGTTTLTQLLQAQAAQLAGDRGAAIEIFRAMTADPASAALGYRGLIMEARRDGNWDEVSSQVEKLRQIKPQTPWLNLVRFELLSRRREWGEASLALAQVSTSGLMEPARVKQNRAALLLATSQQETTQGNHAAALEAAEKAVRQANDWLPAIINLAKCQLADGHPRAARRTIEKNWQRMPHPQLAEIYRSGEPDALDAFSALERLCRDDQNLPLNHMVLAEAALAAKIWGEARRHLMSVISMDNATATTYRLMAKLERGEGGSDAAATRWLTKAADAPADPVWLCRSCGGAHTAWQATCGHCGTFNTLEWQSPGHSRAVRDASPLLSHGWID